jgi:hypothetical protein
LKKDNIESTSQRISKGVLTMKKILLSIAILMSILIITVGCSSKKDVKFFTMNLTPESRVEKLSEVEYTLRMKELAEERKYTDIDGIDRFFTLEDAKKMEGYQEIIDTYDNYYKDDKRTEAEKKESVETTNSILLFTAEDIYIAEELSKFTCTNPEIASEHAQAIVERIEDVKESWQSYLVYTSQDEERIKELQIN